jgi:hypothetical protein
MKPRDTRAATTGLPPNTTPSPRQTPRGVFPAVFRSETTCHPPTHAPQFHPMAECASSRPIPAG